jgi:hypothetical protein
MDWIIDNIQIVVLILLGIGSWIKARMDAKSAESEETTIDSEPVPPFVPERKSAPSVPPPLERAARPPILPSVAAEEAAREEAVALKHQQELEARLRQIRETKATTSGGAAATRARIAAKKSATSTKLISPTLRSRLRDPKEMRRAIVMREILDPPVGLR